MVIGYRFQLIVPDTAESKGMVILSLYPARYPAARLEVSSLR